MTKKHIQLSVTAAASASLKRIRLRDPDESTLSPRGPSLSELTHFKATESVLARHLADANPTTPQGTSPTASLTPIGTVQPESPLSAQAEAPQSCQEMAWNVEEFMMSDAPYKLEPAAPAITEPASNSDDDKLHELRIFARFEWRKNQFASELYAVGPYFDLTQLMFRLEDASVETKHEAEVAGNTLSK
jgi:hypothetical protein